jgi:hypothetical protein
MNLLLGELTQKNHSPRGARYVHFEPFSWETLARLVISWTFDAGLVNAQRVHIREVRNSFIK